MPKARIADVKTAVKLMISILVGREDLNLRAPGPEPRNRCTKLLSRMGLFCMLYRHSA